MSSKSIKLSIVDIICSCLIIVVLVFVIHKCQPPLSYAKEQLAWQEPTWENGLPETGFVNAIGEVRKTRIFFKAQDIILQYDVDGVTYTCENRMLKKDYDKLIQVTNDGTKIVDLRYDPSNPSHATTEKSVDFFKKDKNGYFACKILSILYIIYCVFILLISLFRAILAAIEKKNDKTNEQYLFRLG